MQGIYSDFLADIGDFADPQRFAGGAHAHHRPPHSVRV
jgi:hypothetical protein